MPKQHIIELNGKRYDAVTGEMLSSKPLSNKPQNKSKGAVNRGSIDGFSKPSSRVTRPTSPVSVHKTQKSNTLMRKTVKKPVSHSLKQSPARKGSPGIQTFTSASKQKIEHAASVKKSSLVRKFSEITSAHHAAVIQEPSPKSGRIQAFATATAAHLDPIKSSLEAATSHEEPRGEKLHHHVKLAHKFKISPRLLSGGSLLLAGFLLTGFFAYQNMPNLNMRLASARSGVHGSLPGYKPAGFGQKGGVTYKPGQITISFKSNSDNRNFEIIQTTSSWNSEALEENYFVANKKLYTVVPDKGKVVYLYDESNASWVDGGVWYRIEGNSHLNSDQLLNLANSL